jgi:branched-chain amino acid aminotransferase
MVEPAEPATVVWIDGSLRDPATAGLHWSDHGITVGDGVFETMKLERGAAFALTRHLDRLTRSADGLRMDLPERSGIEAAVAEVADAWGDHLGRLRITVTAGRGPMGSTRGVEGPTLMVTAGAMTLSREPTDVVIVPMTRNESGALVGLKTTSYAENVVALSIAEEAGATEAVFANTRGELCEGTGTNVVLGTGGELRTPPLRSGCLAGVTRDLLLEAMASAGTPVIEEDLPVDALARCDEAFLLSTGRQVQPIRGVDARALPLAPGPLTERAMAVWDAAYSGVTDP